MNRPVRILAMAGSTRAESLNKRLVQIAAAGARAAGAEVTTVDLKDYPLPMYDGDLEAAAGLPESAQKLKVLMAAQDGFLLACPEYNGSITGVLKNTIDWVSRPGAIEPPLAAFTGKVAVLMSASPGALGGLRGLVHVRALLGDLGVIVLPDQIAVPRAHELLRPDGTLQDPALQAGVTDLGRTIASFTAKIAARES